MQFLRKARVCNSAMCRYRAEFLRAVLIVQQKNWCTVRGQACFRRICLPSQASAQSLCNVASGRHGRAALMGVLMGSAQGHCVRSALTPETVLPRVLPGLSSQDLFAGPAVHLQPLAPWLSPGCSACAKMHQHPGNAGNAVARLPVAGSRLNTSVCSIFREAASSLFLPDCTEETLLPACSLSSTSAIRLLPAFGSAGSAQTARHPWHCPLTLSCGTASARS